MRGIGDLLNLPAVPNPPATSPWVRQPVLPDSALPPALQRGNSSVRQAVYRGNAYDAYIAAKSNLWSWIRSHGGLKGCCRLAELGAPIFNQPPWIVQPSMGVKFEKMFSQPLTAFQDGSGNFTGLDVVIGQFVVPNGWDGALNRVVVGFNGTNYVDFLGYIVWRVKVNVRYVRNLGNILNTYGDFATAFSVPGTDNIRLVSQQTITLLGNIPAGSPVGNPGGGPATVQAGAFGWFYPRR